MMVRSGHNQFDSLLKRSTGDIHAVSVQIRRTGGVIEIVHTRMHRLLYLITSI